MAFIAHNFTKISEAADEIYTNFIEEFYAINNYEETIKDKLNSFFSILKKDLNVFIEYPYVDKVFRDSYYFYFSTKHKEYARDSVRISFFHKNVKYTDILNPDKLKFLEENFGGYCILRPTFPDIIGRNMISRNALIKSNFITCIHHENVLLNGIKLTLSGFPHSSQDQESITCAETTIWALMEYFGHKYAEYKPVLPSVIINKLNERSDKRMLPSSGLTPEQISYALKDFGFGTLIYSKDDDKDDFLPALSTYIESGIPVIVAIENKSLAHAILMIGRERTNQSDILKAFYRKTNIIPFSSIIKKYIVQDDNLPPYASIPLTKPAVNYDDSSFLNCKITSFIVPLYRKMYMEVKAARNFMITIFKEPKYGNQSNKKHVFRLYLASSRSFKSHIAQQTLLDNDLRQYLLALAMPRFVYCGEFINKEDAINGKVSSLIVLDATEACENWEDSFIFAAHKNRFIFCGLFDKKYKIIPVKIPFSGFNMYSNNLN